MYNNPNKTISVNSNGIVISYIDNNKHQFIKFENQDAPRRMPAKYQEIEKSVFNYTQQKLYSETLYGLNLYTEETISKMPRFRLIKILDTYNRAQKLINRWKQEIVNHKVDRLMLALFPKSPITKQFVETTGSDDTIKSKFSFKDLKLDQKKIADMLIKEGILPNNFYDLN